MRTFVMENAFWPVTFELSNDSRLNERDHRHSLNQRKQHIEELVKEEETFSFILAHPLLNTGL